jgi:hypothetical protein
MSACDFAHDDAAYVLGALTPAERLAFERHLATCAECTESVQLVAGMPGLLGRLMLSDVESAPEPPPVTLLPHLLEDVRRQQRRRRWTIGLAAAAAVVAVVATTTVVVVAVDDAPPATATAQVMTQVDQDRIDAEVSLTAVAWGTRVDLTCSYDAAGAGYQQDAPPPTYSLVVRAEDGTVEQVATWKALPGKTMHLTGATALDADRITAVEVLTSDGRAVLELTS